MPLHLRTEAWEASAEAICQGSMGVQGFAHTRFAQEVERLARKRLELLEPSEDLGREVVARLGRISPDAKLASAPSWSDVSPEKLSLDHFQRDDLGSIEAKLYSRLAVDWRLEDALGELERLKLRKAATRLAVAVSDDPIEPLKAAMLGEDYMDFRWSLNFALQLPCPDRIEVLLDVLPSLKNPYQVEDVLQHLPSDAQFGAPTAPIDKFYRETEDVDSKIVVATYLARRTQEEAYYEFLLEEALKPPEDLEKHRSVPYYRQAAMETALGWIRTEAAPLSSDLRQRQRREAVAMLRTWLERIPPNANPYRVEMLVSQLDLLGEPEDREVLVRYCPSSICSASRRTERCS
jgi:hypothetical protein